MNDEIVLKNGVIIESVAKLVLVNELNQALVLTIGEYEGRPEKSYTPDLPGGRVEIRTGETELAGVIREAEEEAGVVLDPKTLSLAYTGTTFYESENKSVSRFLYIAHLDHTPEVVVSWEHASYEWVPVDTILQTKKFRPFYATAIEYALTHGLL